MKKSAFFFMLSIFMMASLITQAQDTQWKPIARGQSASGHWLVEQHRDTVATQRVFFYTKDNLLLYKEEVRGIKINVNRDRTVKRLNELLAKVAAEWQNTHAVASRQLVLDHFN
jgi:hypothetical protein